MCLPAFCLSDRHVLFHFLSINTSLMFTKRVSYRLFSAEHSLLLLFIHIAAVTATRVPARAT